MDHSRQHEMHLRVPATSPSLSPDRRAADITPYEEARTIVKGDVTEHLRSSTVPKRWIKDSRVKFRPGASGEVHLERREDDASKLRVVKVISEKEDGSIKKLFLRELEAMALCKQVQYQEFFVQMKCWFVAEGKYHIAMEYCPYGDLHSYCKTPLPERHAKSVARQILQGLKFFHGRGFAHRDLQPKNILVIERKPSFRVKIADFGISKRARSDESTRHSSFCGTNGFIAPEIVSGNRAPYDEKVDIWSLGCLQYWLLTLDEMGLYRFAEHQQKLVKEKLENGNLSEHARDFIDKTLDMNPETRPSAAQALRLTWLSKDDPIFEPDHHNNSESLMPGSFVMDSIYERVYSELAPANLTEKPQYEEPEDLEEERTIMPSNLGSHPDYTRGYGATISREHAVTIEENRGVVGSSGFLSRQPRRGDPYMPHISRNIPTISVRHHYPTEMQASATTIYEDGSQGKRSGVPLCEKSVLEAVTFRDHTVPPDANPIRNIERGIKRNVADEYNFIPKQPQRVGSFKAAPGAPPPELVYAVKERSLSFCQGILNARAWEMDYMDSDGRTALWHAARLGRADVVAMLLSKEAEKGQAPHPHMDDLYWTPLHAAAAYGHASVVKLFLQHPKQYWHQFLKPQPRNIPSPIFFAINGDLLPDKHLPEPEEKKRVETVQALIRFGGSYLDLNMLDAKGCTPFMEALSCNLNEVCRALIQERDVVEGEAADGTTALWYTVDLREEEWFREVLDRICSSANSKAEAGNCIQTHVYRVLYRLSRSSLDELDRNTRIGFLLKRRMEWAGSYDKLCGNLFDLARKGETRNDAVISILLRFQNLDGTFLPIETKKIFKCMLSAAQNEQIPLLEQLLRRNPNLLNRQHEKSGNTILRAAISREEPKLLDWLLQHFPPGDGGLDLETRDPKGRTALIMAAEADSEVMVSRILESGADLEAKTTDGLTALHCAAGRGDFSLSVVKLLLDSPYFLEHILNLEDATGITPIAAASRNSRGAEVIKLLLGRNANIRIADENGMTPMVNSVILGHHENVRAFLDSEVGRQLRIPRILNFRDKYGKTPILYAAEGLKYHGLERYGQIVITIFESAARDLFPGLQGEAFSILSTVKVLEIRGKDHLQPPTMEAIMRYVEIWRDLRRPSSPQSSSSGSNTSKRSTKRTTDTANTTSEQPRRTRADEQERPRNRKSRPTTVLNQPKGPDSDAPTRRRAFDRDGRPIYVEVRPGNSQENRRDTSGGRLYWDGTSSEAYIPSGYDNRGRKSYSDIFGSRPGNLQYPDRVYVQTQAEVRPERRGSKYRQVNQHHRPDPSYRMRSGYNNGPRPVDHYGNFYAQGASYPHPPSPGSHPQLSIDPNAVPRTPHLGEYLSPNLLSPKDAFSRGPMPPRPRSQSYVQTRPQGPWPIPAGQPSYQHPHARSSDALNGPRPRSSSDVPLNPPFFGYGPPYNGAQYPSSTAAMTGSVQTGFHTVVNQPHLHQIYGQAQMPGAPMPGPGRHDYYGS